MNRRTLMIGTIATALAAGRGHARSATVTVGDRIAVLENEIARRRKTGMAISGNWLASQLEQGLTIRERRIAAFRIAQNIPYKLTPWKGDPDSLLVLGQGDCRHKSAALLSVLRALKIEASPVKIPFDWADLPIPPNVLGHLLETRGIHDAVEARIDGRLVLVDPTWDPALKSVGFPVLSEWDGVGPTLPITPNASAVVRAGELKAGTDLFAQFGIAWPQRQRTQAFNRAFNAWTDEVRAGVTRQRQRSDDRVQHSPPP